MNTDINLLKKLAQRTITYFKKDLNLTKISDSYEIKDIKSVEFLDITTLITLSGELSGTVAMSVSTNLAKQMVENFVYGKLDKETISQLAAENVAETLNITLGNIIQDLEITKDGGKVDISTPYTIHDKVSITKKNNGHMYLCIIKYNGENIILSYFI